MDLAVGRGGSACWVEVRPLITAKLESASFASVLDALHDLGKPFRFFIVVPKDGDCGEDERSLVRFFFEFFDEHTRAQMSNVIRTLLDVEVIGGVELPRHQYRFCADLELSKNYALPLVFNGQRQELVVNLIDRLVASVAGLGVCVEVVVQADPNAAGGIQNFVHKKTTPKSTSSTNSLVLDPLVDLLGTGIGKTSKSESAKGRSGVVRVDSWSRELVRGAELKLASNLFVCKILVFGESLQSIQTAKKALPAAPTNKLKTFKTTKKPKQHPTPTLRTPTRHVMRNNVLCRLWWAIPLSLLLLAGFFGLFNPLNLVLSASISGVDLGFVGFGVFLAVCLFMGFRKRQPIVLSTQELAQIVGLPTAVEKLPVVLGKVPLSRMQLDYENQPTKKAKKQEEDKNPTVENTKEEVTDVWSQECKTNWSASSDYQHGFSADSE
ncbi:hypothetical protein [Candidatus Bathycorpusculum sp.]|uniref:hypothetical protein n=1 Tax=Candidatus Bathycorpusculum sp. TaxID=2994959 RepID=UPI002818B260|nr:hypothetical protein [Candidatus Termitimicrobium sp.]